MVFLEVRDAFGGLNEVHVAAGLRVVVDDDLLRVVEALVRFRMYLFRRGFVFCDLEGGPFL